MDAASEPSSTRLTSGPRPPLNYGTLAASGGLLLVVGALVVHFLDDAKHERDLAEFGIRPRDRVTTRAVYGPHYFQMGVGMRVSERIVQFYAKNGRVPDSLSEIWPSNGALRFDVTRIVAWNQEIDYLKTGNDSWLFISGGDNGSIQVTFPEAEGIREMELGPGGDEVWRYRIGRSKDGELGWRTEGN